MPLFTDLPSFGYYYSGNVSPYSNHSSLGGSYSRSPYSLSSYSGYSRGYSPLLSTISESRTGVISRINSPKRLHLQSTAKYRAPKPIRINTADIDVSANKYRRERPTPTTTPESHIVYGVSAPNAPNAPLQDGPFMPRAEPHEDDNTNRSTIKRGRTVVRLSTIRSRTSGPPENEGKTNWRRELAQDLTFKDEKKVRKTPGEKLIEKHLIRDKSTENTSSLDVEDEEEEGPLECRGRAPSFHDICKDISSDKLYDDLNAGELRRIADRRKSEDKSTISPIMEVPSEIVDVFNEDGTFHRRTTLKKLRKSTKGIFIHMPDTQDLDPNVGLDINLNKENSCKSPKITASVEVQNSEPSLRAVATEVQVETKHNAQKRKFFYKIVVEDVIEIKPNEKSDTSNEDHNANTLHDIPTNVTGKTTLYSKTENISSKELDKEQKKETKEKKNSAKRLSKKSVKKDHRSSKSKIADDNADNFWDVIGSRESVYYTARRKRILEEQRNRYAFDEIIPEVPDSPSMNSTESDKPIASTGIDHVIKTNCNMSNESSSPASKIMPKNKKNATEQPLDARNQPTEIKSKSVAQITPKVPVQKESVGNSTPSAINKEKSPKASDIPKSTSNESILKPSLTQTSTPLPINKEKSSKVPVIPKTTSNECIPKPSIETQEKDTMKSLNEVPLSPASKAVLQTKSVSKSISPEICPKKEDQIKKTDSKNTKGNDVLVSVSPKESAPSVLSSKSIGQENNIVKGDTNIETKPSADIAKSPEVPAEKLPTVSKPRNKKYVKAKTLDLRQNEDTCKELSTKTLPKDQTDKEPTKSNELKKRNSETDISKRSETKSTMGKIETKDGTPLKSKQTNVSVVPTIDKVLPKPGNDLTKEKPAINSKATKDVKSPTINEKIPTNTDMIPNEDKKDKVPTKNENTPSKEKHVINTNITEVAKDVKSSAVIQKVVPLEKADVKQNDDKKESSADLKTKKLCKPIVKPTKQIDEVHKSPEIKTTIERNVATTLEAKKADNSVIPATKENVDPKTEKQINKNTVTETTKIMEPQVKIEGKQKLLKGEALKINNEIKNTSADIKSKKSSKPSVKVGKSNNEVKSPISDPKTVINNDVQKCVESDNLQNQLVSLEESKSKLNEKVTELSALLHDTSAISVPKISERTPSSHSSGRQSLKSFSERVTERVRNPSLRLVTRQPDEPKLKPSLISMNTSSDLTAIMKEPITPVDKKIKLIPKNEPAPKPLIATPRPLQAIIRNRKAQLHQSIDSESDDSSDSSWTDSSEEESEESEFFECGSPIDNPIASMENLIATEPSYVYAQFLKTSKIIPPATKIPRFRKYAVEDFNFLKVLGKGSFGKVLLAELKNTEFYYAVKCLNKNIVLEDDDVECTLIERKVLALGTKHPYLCHLFCTFQTESHLFFVMEYLNGGDLMFHIQHSGRFPEPRASFYAAEIVSGLRFLHKKGIVYRDLKLDNILLDFDGHVRIADFGMCKLQIYLDKTADTFCGTPDYMAPEIIKGLKYNQSVDWWSFGVLLYEMLIGQSPFSGCDEDELFWSICNEIPYYPRHLSSEALEILTRFLNKDSEVRLGSGTCPYGDVTEQRFFQDIDWGRLERRQLEPPFKPRVLHPLDTQYFDKAFTGEAARLTPIDEAVIRGMDHDRFHGFSYTNPNATD